MPDEIPAPTPSDTTPPDTPPSATPPPTPSPAPTVAITPAAAPAPTPVPAAPAFAGFDTDIYPGDHAMTLWKSASPYVFSGYYLHAPCHGNATWMGHRAALAAMGWNLVPIYVGQQVPGVSPCKSGILTPAQGRLDAVDCCAKMVAEKFPTGTFVYLDVEHCDIFPSGLRDYITAWVTALVAGGFGPGVYCHVHNASDVRAAVTAGLSASPEAALVTTAPRFWVVGGVVAKFDVQKSHPADSGIAFADMWQCPPSVTRTFGGVKVNIDEDCATLRDPAAPAPPGLVTPPVTPPIT